MAHIGLAVRRRRTKLGWTIQKLATLSGLDAGFISRLENQKSGYTPETEECLARTMSTTVKTFHDSESNVEEVALGHKRIPILTWARAGELVEQPMQFTDEDMKQFVMGSDDLSTAVFGLRLKDDSMQSQFQEGDLVIIDPEASLLPGDLVVAKDANSPEATFKKYRLTGTLPDGRQSYQLVPLNPDYPTLSFPEKELQIIGVMVEHRIPRRRS